MNLKMSLKMNLKMSLKKIQNKRGLRNLKRLLHMSLKSLWLKSQKYWMFLKQP